jgi:hypothetical protein
LNVFQIKITLKHIRPQIWRRIQVPADIKLGRLHDIIQAVMGWEDCHLHQFIRGRDRYGNPDPEFPDGTISEKNIRLDKIAKPGDTFIYEYDFGDSWQHEIKIEKILPPEDQRYPVCLAGKRACPPEDCGGFPGYLHLLEALSDPGHEEHEDMRDWIGGDFDPEAFDLVETNKALWRLR